ncbi:Leucine Rich repeat [Carpediemonas membranifera]|uniref:Leucine Rich repeat n=1 Tax=Carpediemonas membranifera TaxID=201153 RepID=A0A8J6B1I5_9EUKA|nr:Leucine Rich repeat [Carpediemonas membranifera]|eukprot:KAG9391037.1 Leucine Rich repeat [Carpediemonas membranifera]
MQIIGSNRPKHRLATFSYFDSESEEEFEPDVEEIDSVHATETESQLSEYADLVWESIAEECPYLLRFRPPDDNIAAVTQFISAYTSSGNVPVAIAPALFDLLPLFSNLTAIDLRGNALDTNDAALLSECLSPLRLEQLMLGFNPLGDDGVGFIAMELCPDLLVKLELSSVGMGVEGAEALACVLRKAHRLESLDLSANPLGADGACALALNSMPHLAQLHMQGSAIGDDGAEWVGKYMCRMQELRSLDLGQNDIRSRGAVGLALSLDYLTNLNSLVLDDNPLNSEGGAMLCSVLDRLTRVQVLGIARTCLNRRALASLAKALPGMPLLSDLRLWGTDLGPASDLLADALTPLTRLRTLNLWDCGIRPDALPAVLRAASDADIREIYLGSQPLLPAAVAALAELLAASPTLRGLSLPACGLGEEAMVTLAPALAHVPQLRELNLRDNDLGRSGGLMLARLLPPLPQLQVAFLQDCGLDDIASYRVAQAFLRCPALQALHLRGNEISRRIEIKIGDTVGETYVVFT